MMGSVTALPHLRHPLIQHQDDQDSTPPTLVSSSRDSSRSCSPDPSYIPLQEKAPLPSSFPIDAGMGHRPSHSIFNLLNGLTVASPASSPDLSPLESSSSIAPTLPLQAISAPPMSAALSDTTHSGFFPREHRPSVDMPSTSVIYRPDLYRRHSAHPYEVNPATNRIIYREFDFSPVGSRAPISRTTKACNACRSRKVRCDAGGSSSGDVGVCSRCREAGIECAYSGLQKKRGPLPGTARPPPNAVRRQSSQHVAVSSPPPELSPTFDPRSSYGFSSTDQEQYYVPPLTPTQYQSFPPPSQQPHHHIVNPSGSGWTSAQPRPLPSSSSSSSHSRRPSSSTAPPLSRKPSFVSWHPSDIPEESSRMFRKEYSMDALAEESTVSIESEADWRASQYSHSRDSSWSTSGSAFGGDGRSLPPLRVMLGNGWNSYEPRNEI